jgi:hypothetical protein
MRTLLETGGLTATDPTLEPPAVATAEELASATAILSDAQPSPEMDARFRKDAPPSPASHLAAARLDPTATPGPPPPQLQAHANAGETAGDPGPEATLPQQESVDLEATLEAERMVLVEGLQDKYRVDCVKWAARGGCSRNANWMKLNCALSCKNREWTEQLETRRQSLEEALRPQHPAELPSTDPSQAAAADAAIQASTHLQADIAAAVVSAAAGAAHGPGIPESSDTSSPNDAVDLELQHEEQELRIDREEQHQNQLAMDTIEPEALPHVQRILAERQRAAEIEEEARQDQKHIPGE